MTTTEITTEGGECTILVSVLRDNRIEIVTMKNGRYTSAQLTIDNTRQVIEALYEHVDILEHR